MVCYYTGKEPSPKGLGLCAHDVKENTIHKGRDGKQWIVKTDKNGRHSWRRFTDTENKSNNKKKVLPVVYPALKKAKTMTEAKKIVATLLEMEKQDDETVLKYLGESKDNRTILFFPQKNIKVRRLKTFNPKAKGYVYGQGSAAAKLGVIYHFPPTVRYDVIKNTNKKEMKFLEENSYMKSLLVTGSGADPVYEVL